jgi:uncharacterized protein involved in exopolysaccharide biosynthesis
MSANAFNPYALEQEAETLRATIERKERRIEREADNAATLTRLKRELRSSKTDLRNVLARIKRRDGAKAAAAAQAPTHARVAIPADLERFPLPADGSIPEWLKRTR